MNNARTLSGIDSDNIRHLALPSSTAALLIGGDSGSFGQVLTKNEDTNKLEWDDIERRNIAPNSIDGSRLRNDISFITSGAIRCANPESNATLSGDIVQAQQLITTTQVDLRNGITINDRWLYFDPAAVFKLQLYNNLLTNKNIRLVDTITGTLTKLISFDVEDATSTLPLISTNGIIKSTGLSTLGNANVNFLEIAGKTLLKDDVKIEGALEVDGGIDIGNIDVFGDVKMRRLQTDTLYWFNYQKGVDTTAEDFDITLHNVMSINDAGTSGNRIDFTTATGEIKTTGSIVSNLVGGIGLSVKGNSQFINDVFVENELFLQTDDTDNTTRKIELDANNGNIHQYSSYTDATTNVETFSVKDGDVEMDSAKINNAGDFIMEKTDGTKTFEIDGDFGDITTIRNIVSTGIINTSGDIIAGTGGFFGKITGSTGIITATTQPTSNSIDVNRSIKCGQIGDSAEPTIPNPLLGFETNGDLLLNQSALTGSYIRTDNKLNVVGRFNILPTTTSDNQHPVIDITTETNATAVPAVKPVISLNHDVKIRHTAANGTLTDCVVINVGDTTTISTFQDELRVNRFVGATDTNFFNIDPANQRAFVRDKLFIQEDLFIGQTGYDEDYTKIEAITSDIIVDGVAVRRRLLNGYGDNLNGNQPATWSIQGNDTNNQQSSPNDGNSYMIINRLDVRGNANKLGNTAVEDKGSIIKGVIDFQPIDGDGTIEGGDPETGAKFRTQTNNNTLGSVRISILPNKQDANSGTKGVSSFGGAILFNDCIDGGGVVGYGDTTIANCEITFENVDKADHTGGLVFKSANPAINGFSEENRTKCFNLDLSDTSNTIPTAVADPHDCVCLLQPATEGIFPPAQTPPDGWFNYDFQFLTGEGGTNEPSGLINSNWFLEIPTTTLSVNLKLQCSFNIYVEEKLVGGSGNQTGNRDGYYRWNYTSSEDNFATENVIGENYYFLFSGGDFMGDDGINLASESIFRETILTFPNNSYSYRLFPRFSNKPEGNNERAHWEFAFGGNKMGALLRASPIPVNFRTA